MDVADGGSFAATVPFALPFKKLLAVLLPPPAPAAAPPPPKWECEPTPNPCMAATAELEAFEARFVGLC